MEFVMQWLWCLAAFAVGSMLAWVITVISVRRTSKEEALADMPGSRETGAQ